MHRRLFFKASALLGLPLVASACAAAGPAPESTDSSSAAVTLVGGPGVVGTVAPAVEAQAECDDLI